MPNSEERTSVGRQRWHSHDRSLSIRSVNQRHGSSSNSPRACCAAVVLCRSWQCWSPTRSNRRILVVECPGWGLFFTVPHGNTPCMVSAKGAIKFSGGPLSTGFSALPRAIRTVAAARPADSAASLARRLLLAGFSVATTCHDMCSDDQPCHGSRCIDDREPDVVVLSGRCRTLW